PVFRAPEPTEEPAQESPHASDHGDSQEIHRAIGSPTGHRCCRLLCIGWRLHPFHDFVHDSNHESDSEPTHELEREPVPGHKPAQAPERELGYEHSPSGLTGFEIDPCRLELILEPDFPEPAPQPESEPEYEPEIE